MATEELRSRTFNVVTRGLVETGRSPHFTDLASVLGVSAVEAREAQHEAAEGSIACWFEPETDNVSSWAPFSNVQNQHRLSVDGEQKWFAQCGVEALAAPQLFPGQEVLIETKCPQTATDIRIRIKDGEILEQEPADAAVLVNQPFDRITNAFTEGEYSLAYA